MEFVRIGTFTPSVLLEVARRTGRLDAAGIVVEEELVSSSPAQMGALQSGHLDIIVTSPDNVLAYRFLSTNPLDRSIDLVITAALDGTAGLSLCLRPGLKSFSNFRVGVDVPGSGFAFAAFALLDLAGHARSNYEVVALGSSPRRAKALIAGDCDVTILGAGNELVAEASGCVIHSQVERLGPYLGEVTARLRTSASSAAADALSTVLVETANAILKGTLQEVTTEAATDVLRLPPELGEAHYERLVRNGLIHGGVVDQEAIGTLVKLRKSYLPSPELEQILPELASILSSHASGSEQRGDGDLAQPLT